MIAGDLFGKLALNLLEDSSSDSEDDLEIILLESGQRRGRIEDYVEKTVPKYNPTDFRSHFRLTRTLVEVKELCTLLHEPSVDVMGRPSVPMLNSVLLTLWTLSNQESFRGIGDRFGFLKGHTHTLFIMTCKVLVKKLRQIYMEFPSTRNHFRELARCFNSLRGNRSFLNVVAVIDAMHVSIPGPANDNSFFDRKSQHSMIVEGICNHQLEFLDIFAGWPGSSHDSRVWHNSPIYERIEHGDANIPPEMHILGDSAYPLTPFLIVPFKDNGHLTEQQRRFNAKLSSTRVVIEQAWGRLIGIFRRLRYLHIYKRENFKYIVLAACILHNFIIRENDNNEYDYGQEIAEGMAHVNDNILQHQDYEGGVHRTGAQKRNYILQQM